jgi:hypothetical protein
MLGTNFGTIHNSMTSIQFECIIELGQTFVCKIVARVLNPTVGLHEDCGTEVFVGVPPVGWTGGGAAGAHWSGWQIRG